MFENNVEVSAAPVYKHQEEEEEEDDDGGSQFGEEIVMCRARCCFLIEF